MLQFFNNKIKLDHSLEFASVLKIWGRVRGTLFIHVYIKKKGTSVKSQFAVKVYFIERKTLDIAWDLFDFHKLIICHLLFSFK